MYRYDLHIHTAECDKVAQVGGAEIVKLYKDAGYDGLVITDHYFALFYDWFQDEISTSRKIDTNTDLVDILRSGEYRIIESD